MICGVEGRYMAICATSATSSAARRASANFAALSLVITAKGVYFLADTHVSPTRRAEEIAEMAMLRGDPCAPLRHRAEDRAAVAFGFRQLRDAIRRARCARRSS